MNHSLPVDEIIIAPNRQRKEIKDIDSLVESIRRLGLINPIVIDENNVLIAGERRLTAWKKLREEEQILGMNDYAEIPVRYFSELDTQTKRLVELDENIRRQDITWQEQASAIKEIHEHFKAADPKWTKGGTAEYLGLHTTTVSNYLSVFESPVADQAIFAAPSITSAMTTIRRKEDRLRANSENKLADIIKQGLQLDGLDTPEEIENLSTKSFEIVNANSIDWMNNYSGDRFNLIHCDFPYGIGFDTGWDNSADQWGSYADSPDVYWELLRALAKNWSRIAAPSCHFMFWFSMKYYSETLEFFRKEIPSLKIDAFPLIWHKSDNKGSLPDPNRGPRRTYETAFFGHQGDRKIVRAVSNSVALPTNKSEAIHISEKPIDMLKYFFTMLVDSESTILDLTCGSGTSIRAAECLGATRGLGLELNPEYAAVAQKALREQMEE